MEISDVQVNGGPIDGYERVVRGIDHRSGLHALIAVHDTTLGPALGGLRMWPYHSEEEALFDVLRLAEGMTFKSALARTDLGGGKAVIIGDPAVVKSEGLYLSMGQLIDSLGGRYITAEDVNTKIADLEIVARATRHVTGLRQAAGGSGNPSPYTAYGCFLGVEACLQRVFGDASVKGRVVAIQGVGSVGGSLAKRLVENGATVYGADINTGRLECLAREIGLHPVEEGEALRMKADVFAPCALGGLINDETLGLLNCRIVAGAANNQLLEDRHGQALRDRGILYAPDYVINAGGIINIGCELDQGGYDESRSLDKIRRIPIALDEVFDLAEQRDVPTNVAADQRAQQILSEARAAQQA